MNNVRSTQKFLFQLPRHRQDIMSHTLYIKWLKIFPAWLPSLPPQQRSVSVEVQSRSQLTAPMKTGIRMLNRKTNPMLVRKVPVTTIPTMLTGYWTAPALSSSYSVAVYIQLSSTCGALTEFYSTRATVLLIGKSVKCYCKFKVFRNI